MVQEHFSGWAQAHRFKSILAAGRKPTGSRATGCYRTAPDGSRRSANVGDEMTAPDGSRRTANVGDGMTAPDGSRRAAVVGGGQPGFRLAARPFGLLAS
jgi:hypothetical protein